MRTDTYDPELWQLMPRRPRPQAQSERSVDEADIEAVVRAVKKEGVPADLADAVAVSAIDALIARGCHAQSVEPVAREKVSDAEILKVWGDRDRSIPEYKHVLGLFRAGESAVVAPARGIEPSSSLVDAAMAVARYEYGHGVKRSSIIAIWEALGCPQTTPPSAGGTRIPGLGSMTDEDDGFVTLQFKDESAAQDFMRSYSPSVSIKDMPEIDRQETSEQLEVILENFARVQAERDSIAEEVARLIHENSVLRLQLKQSVEPADVRDAVLEELIEKMSDSIVESTENLSEWGKGYNQSTKDTIDGLHALKSKGSHEMALRKKSWWHHCSRKVYGRREGLP